MASERHTAAFVVGLALGGLAGAGYVLFKTPRSGKDVRAGIAARFQGLVGAVRETAEVVGTETLRAGEQTVEKIEATGAAVRERIPSMPAMPNLPSLSGVADLIPGNRNESDAASRPGPTDPIVSPDTPTGVDELADAIAGDATGPEDVAETEAPPVAQPAPSVYAAAGTAPNAARANGVHPPVDVPSAAPTTRTPSSGT